MAFHKEFMLAIYSQVLDTHGGENYMHLAKNPYVHFYGSIYVPKGVTWREDVSWTGIRCEKQSITIDLQGCQACKSQKNLTRF